jgi:hypothetical protein
MKIGNMAVVMVVVLAVNRVMGMVAADMVVAVTMVVVVMVVVVLATVYMVTQLQMCYPL